MAGANGRRPERSGSPAARKPFAFYRRLTKAQKREYERSDLLTALPLAPDSRLAAAANRVVAALGRSRTAEVRRAAQELVDGICARLSRRGRPAADPPRVKVLRTRPRLADGEFHGLYTRDARGRSEIRVWMLTAAQRHVVRPRTFLRTLLHEVVHHVDITMLDLPSSFHTLGFHARESSLLRALERGGARVPGGRAGAAAAAAPAPPPKQLPLF